jgi:uncharacterized membrane protein
MRIVDQVRARPRSYIALVIVVALALRLPDSLLRSTRLLLAWDAGILFWLCAVGLLMVRSDADRMRQRAEDEDDGAVVILLASSLSAIASLVAIAVELSAVKHSGAPDKALHLALAGTTVFCSWLFVHLSFTLHYAHEYYGTGENQGGLEFPGPKREADYFDFAYFAINIGAASQTSDVPVTRPGLRRIVLAHAVLSFFFNTMVLALGVNVAASAL